MNSVKVMQVTAVALFASISGPSQAAQSADYYAYCWWKGPSANVLTDVFKTDILSRPKLRTLWLEYTNANYGPDSRLVSVDCVNFSDQADVVAGRAHFPGAQSVSWRPTTANIAGKRVPEPRKPNITEPRNDSATAVPLPKAAASPKYVEVPGPNGVIRLSPEVAARNKTAAEEYQRKLKAVADTVAQAKADAERKAAQLAAEKQKYELQLAANAAQVAAHKAKMDSYNQSTTQAGGIERTFQATGAIRATKDEAMASLMGQNLPPISSVQCKEVTSYQPARWTCWGTYRQAVSQSSTSKQ